MSAAPAARAASGAAPTTRTYLLCWVALMVLTVLTFTLSFVHTGALALPIALLIATGKSLLVVFIFMHVVQARPSSWLLLLAGIALALILFALIAADVLTRQVLGTPPVG